MSNNYFPTDYQEFIHLSRYARWLGDRRESWPETVSRCFDFMQEHGTQATSLEECITRLEAIPNERPIYMTLDLDFFDPAFMPGTGTPEAGGENFHSFVKFMKILKDKNFVGADIVELAPNIDTTGNSAAFASKVVREILLALQD